MKNIYVVLFLVSYLLFATKPAMAEPVMVSVEVTEERLNSTESATLYRARARAVIEGLDSLPSIIVGREQMRRESNMDDYWSLDIKAIIATQAKTNLINLSWDDDRTVLNATFQVYLDYQETMAMINGIQSSLTARSKLRELYSQLVKSIDENSSLVDLASFKAETDNIIFNYFNSLSHEGAVSLKNAQQNAARTLSSYEEYREQVKVWDSLTVEVIDVRDNAVVVDIRAAYLDAPQNVLRRFCIARQKADDYTILSGLRFIHPDSRLVLISSGSIREGDELLWANRRVPGWRRDREEFNRALRSANNVKSDIPEYGYVLIAGELGLNLNAILANPGLILDRIGGC